MLNEFNVGDRVEIFVAEFFHRISPTELQPQIYTDYGSDNVPGSTGWIPGIIVKYIKKGGNWLYDVWEVEHDQLRNGHSGAIVPIEYIRYGSGSVNTEWHTQG